MFTIELIKNIILAIYSHIFLNKNTFMLNSSKIFVTVFYIKVIKTVYFLIVKVSLKVAFLYS